LLERELGSPSRIIPSQPNSITDSPANKSAAASAAKIVRVERQSKQREAVPLFQQPPHQPRRAEFSTGASARRGGGRSAEPRQGMDGIGDPYLGSGARAVVRRPPRRSSAATEQDPPAAPHCTHRREEEEDRSVSRG